MMGGFASLAYRLPPFLLVRRPESKVLLDEGMQRGGGDTESVAIS